MLKSASSFVTSFLFFTVLTLIIDSSAALRIINASSVFLPAQHSSSTALGIATSMPISLRNKSSSSILAIRISVDASKINIITNYYIRNYIAILLICQTVTERNTARRNHRKMKPSPISSSGVPSRSDDRPEVSCARRKEKQGEKREMFLAEIQFPGLASWDAPARQCQVGLVTRRVPKSLP